MNPAELRKDFPILSVPARGHKLVYLDNAATTQKPNAVLEALQRYYTHDNANIHRAVYELAERATRDYEGAREKVRRFLNAQRADEIVFVRGATEGLNLIAKSFGGLRVRAIGAGAEIIVTEMEHHSNIVPWQMLCNETGARLRVAPINERGELELEYLKSALSSKTALLSVTHVSNALGTINAIDEIIAMAREAGVPVVVDGAQAVPHLSVDVQKLDCDFYVFSGHKVYGPTGIGAVYGKSKWWKVMPPYQGGGDMILSVTFEKTEYNVPPYKFEAGTPDIAGAIGLGAALDYVTRIGLGEIARYEHGLLEYATERLSAIRGLKVIGTAKHKSAVISFTLDGIHPHDMGTILDREGIAIRTGHHCAQPVMEHYGVAATARASFSFYNTREEVDALVAGLHEVIGVFGGGAE